MCLTADPKTKMDFNVILRAEYDVIEMLYYMSLLLSKLFLTQVLEFMKFDIVPDA